MCVCSFCFFSLFLLLQDSHLYEGLRIERCFVESRIERYVSDRAAAIYILHLGPILGEYLIANASANCPLNSRLRLWGGATRSQPQSFGSWICSNLVDQLPRLLGESDGIRAARQ